MCGFVRRKKKNKESKKKGCDMVVVQVHDIIDKLRLFIASIDVGFFVCDSLNVRETSEILRVFVLYCCLLGFIQPLASQN